MMESTSPSPSPSPAGNNAAAAAEEGDGGRRGRRPDAPAVKTPLDLLERIPIGHPDDMMSAESVRRAAEEFVTRPSDVVVATFPKTGTTLVTWICHLLRTGARPDERLEGRESFTDVVPWPMLSWDVGIDPNVAGCEFAPRVFKSHLRMASVYPGCRYVVTVRDPGRVALSFYNFFIAKRVPFLVDERTEDGDADAEPRLLMDASEFLVDTKFVRGCPKTPSSDLRASVWEYYAEYHALMECPCVLMLVYEDFVGDEDARTESIRALGNFLGVLGRGANAEGEEDGDDEDARLVARTASMSTKAYMANIMSKFDEPYERAKELGRAADVSQLAPGAKVALRTHTQTFDDRATRFLEEQWEETMEPLGYRDYNSFCAAVRERNRRLFE